MIPLLHCGAPDLLQFAAAQHNEVDLFAIPVAFSS